ncbi:MAG: Sodium/proton antiporter [Candidatus Wolfebacteria bacterium GW2011_GWC1_37_10]|uniref:Sodium/proton antiporter n=1 Tax=Candidatus Wolfebacteria bacterium GW2011_GWC1_37_10 TaxID=1619010 RepID=A0A0G0FWN5_9BACT|nr:MAG: Sodium/proton antiporter [Candidatus Wolfebacteria bacterium GW2011_GWC1_37_10]
MENSENKKIDYFLPASIIIAAVLISGAWVYSAGLKNLPSKEVIGEKQQKAQILDAVDNVSEINNEDHIRGNPNALIKIIEFSDMECPFCKNFHQTMIKIISEYGSSGKVAWIYRHFPLEQLHSKAKTSAVASECAAELGGNNAFWNFLDKYFEITPSNDKFNLSELPKIAQNIGLNVQQFENCLSSGKYDEKIESQIQEAMDSGARGTPYSILIDKNNKKQKIDGSLPYSELKTLIEEALR